MTTLKRSIGVLSLGAWLFSACLPVAAAPSAAQIAQFKTLPKSQQAMLAKQYGVSLDELNDISKTSTPAVAAKSTIAARNVVTTNKVATQTKTEKEAKQKLRPFGYQLFAGQPTSDTPLADLPVPSNYKVAPGDTINLQIYGKDNNDYRLKVRRDGNINIPHLGPVNVMGRDFNNLEGYLTSLIKQKIIGVKVAITLGNLRTMQIYVLGEAFKPGAVNLSSLSTATQGIIAAGGVRLSGSLRDIQLKRDGAVIASLDLYDMLINGSRQSDLRLQDGDTIFIPNKGNEIWLDGAVRRPAIYELKGNEQVQDLIKYAGGFTANAYSEQMTIERRTMAGKVTIDVATDHSSKSATKLKNGDLVRVDNITDNFKSGITLMGAVERPGSRAWFNGIRINDVLANVQQDLAAEADLNYALVIRVMNERRDIAVLDFNLSNAILDPKSADNMLLESRDRIIVFSQIDKKVADNVSSDDATKNVDLDTSNGKSNLTNVDKLLQQAATTRQKLLEPILAKLKLQAEFGQLPQIVEIRGNVRFPGLYPQTENMSLTELVGAAGGLSAKAYADKIEVSRLNTAADQVVLEQLNVNLSQQRFILNNADVATVYTKPGWTSNHKVVLLGEVMFPGEYNIQRGETIDDVVKRAGGFTAFAYPDGAVFSRESLKVAEQKSNALLAENLRKEISAMSLRRTSSTLSSQSSPAEALQIADELSNTAALGRLIIDLPDIMYGDDHVDVALEDGDTLYVPPLRNVINVVGEVYSASAHVFNKKLTLDDYILRSGGTKSQADTDNMYVIRANGSVSVAQSSFWFTRDTVELEPGDTIVLPIDAEYLDGITTISAASEILYQMGVAVQAIKP
jgi:polysaccharide export outer membrane protein